VLADSLGQNFEWFSFGDPRWTGRNRHFIGQDGKRGSGYGLSVLGLGLGLGLGLSLSS